MTPPREGVPEKGSARPPYRLAPDEGKEAGAINPPAIVSNQLCFEYVSGGSCRTGGYCPHRRVTAAQYQALKDGERSGSRARGSSGVCLFRGRANLELYEDFSGDSPAESEESDDLDGLARPMGRWPSVLTVIRDPRAIDEPIDIDPEDVDFKSAPDDQPYSEGGGGRGVGTQRQFVTSVRRPNGGVG